MPTILRNVPSEIPEPEISERTPPLAISVTQTIDDRAEALALQRIAYGLQQSGHRPIYLVFWLWIIALLSFVALAQDEINSKGFYAFMADLPIGVVLPSLLILTTLTAAYLVLIATADRRREAKQRRHLRRMGEDKPGRLDVVFDAAGMAATFSSGEARNLKWQDALTLHEDEAYLCFYRRMEETHLVIPKRDLSAAEIEAVRHCNVVRNAIAPSPAPPVTIALIGREIVRSEDFTADKDDLVAAMVELADAPHWRHGRYMVYLWAAVTISLITPLFYLLSWLADPERLPVSLALPLYLEMFSSSFWKPAVIGTALVGVFAFVQERFRSYGAGLFADKIIAAGPLGTDFVAIGENGLWSAVPSLERFTPWTAIRSVKITPAHIIVTLPIGTVIAYPKRFFPQDCIPEIEALFRQRTGLLPAIGGPRG